MRSLMLLGTFACLSLVGCSTSKEDDCSTVCTQLFDDCDAGCDETDDDCRVTCEGDRDLCVTACDDGVAE